MVQLILEILRYLAINIIHICITLIFSCFRPFWEVSIDVSITNEFTGNICQVPNEIDLIGKQSTTYNVFIMQSYSWLIEISCDNKNV